eukprot:351489-Hanusia_phi.AAC.1
MIPVSPTRRVAYEEEEEELQIGCAFSSQQHVADYAIKDDDDDEKGTDGDDDVCEDRHEDIRHHRKSDGDNTSQGAPFLTSTSQGDFAKTPNISTKSNLEVFSILILSSPSVRVLRSLSSEEIRERNLRLELSISTR